MESALIPAFVATADAPFNLDRKDVVLRSEDGIDFYTFKAHLSSASEVLNHLLSSATPNGELADGLPIIPFYDPGTVLRGLLCYCDPNIDSRTCSAPLIDVQNLAMKYDMTPVARAVYRDRIRVERELPPSDMLNVIRQRVGQDEDVRLAAAIIFTYENEVPEEMVDVGLVTKAQFDSLVRYREDCRAKAVSVASPDYKHFTWMSPTYNWFRPNEEHDNKCKWGDNIFIASVQGTSRSSLVGVIHRRGEKSVGNATLGVNSHKRGLVRPSSGRRLPMPLLWREFGSRFQTVHQAFRRGD